MGKLLSYLGIASSEEIQAVQQHINNIGKSLSDITTTQKIVLSKLDELNTRINSLSSALNDGNYQIDNHLSQVDSSNAIATKEIAVKIEEISLRSNQLKPIYEKLFNYMIDLHQEITSVKDKQLQKEDIELLEESLRLILATQIMNNVEYTLDNNNTADINQATYKDHARIMDI